MFKGFKKYIWIFSALFLLLILVQYALPVPIDWKRTYSAKSKTPFGCFAVYNLLEGVFATEVEKSDMTLFMLDEEIDSENSLLIINEHTDFNENDMAALYSILDRGNNVLIASGDFGSAFRDSLHVDCSAYWGMEYFLPEDSLAKEPGISLNLSASNLGKKEYAYPKLLRQTYFSRFDSTRFKVLADYNKGQPCVIRTRIGEGNLYLVSLPDVFGNYFVVNHPNRELAYSILSFLPSAKIIWDEYYKTDHISRTSLTSYIFDSPALYTAYLLIFLSVILFLVFESRRRQRAIPVLANNTNSTLDFVNVISHVYYNSKNHRHIAFEKIRYFEESLRKRFGVNTNNSPETYLNEIAGLSGVSLILVRQLMTYCEKIKASTEITDYELKELNRQIQNFNKNSQR